MLLVGFGLLMTFLKKYGFSGMGFNFLLAAMVVQWATIVQGFFEMKAKKIHVGLDRWVNMQRLSGRYVSSEVLAWHSFGCQKQIVPKVIIICFGKVCPGHIRRRLKKTLCHANSCHGSHGNIWDEHYLNFPFANIFPARSVIASIDRQSLHHKYFLSCTLSLSSQKRLRTFHKVVKICYIQR